MAKWDNFHGFTFLSGFKALRIAHSPALGLRAEEMQRHQLRDLSSPPWIHQRNIPWLYLWVSGLQKTRLDCKQKLKLQSIQGQISWRRAWSGLDFISPISWTLDQNFCCCNKTWNSFRLTANDCGCAASIQQHNLQRGHISSLIHLKSRGCMTSLWHSLR